MKKINAKIALIISIVLLVISIIVYFSFLDRSITGCIAGLIMMPISCLLVCVSALIYNYVKVRPPRPSRSSLPSSDISTKRLSEIATERKEATIFCSSCGEKNNPDSIHCSNCGFQL